MSKELEAFNEIIDKFAEQMMRANKEALTAINKTNAIEYLYRTPQVILLQQALQRLEAIENAKPSEALECLEKPIIKFAKTSEDIDFRHYEEYEIIKQALLKAQEQESKIEILKEYRKDYLNRLKNLEKYSQEQEKVLEILKSKKYIPLDKINPKFWDNEEDYNETVDYEFYLWLCEEECEYVVKEEQRLTQEEFDLLKRYTCQNE